MTCLPHEASLESRGAWAQDLAMQSAFKAQVRAGESVTRSEHLEE